ncbi:hypothetical protein [Kineosporia babensis]|uniref:PH domain-containing protein n=1 Tax=Kineosporia babensis TaxID=499548 RepID=A0A9X1NDK8_9ACTN|nr:hypothetical protein [Kineosporia babensis]MCD5311791.1 hypothetical protein [Kineosporia babensis]
MKQTNQHLAVEIPPGWPQPRLSWKLGTSLIVCALMGWGLCKFAEVGMQAGDTALAIMFGSMGVLLLAIVVFNLFMLWQPRPSRRPPRLGWNHRDERGMAFFYARKPMIVFLLFLELCVVSQGGRLFAIEDLHPVIPGLVLTVFFLVFNWILVGTYRDGRGKLVLTPSGVYHRSGVWEQFVPWELVTDVKAVKSRPQPSIEVAYVPAVTVLSRNHGTWLGVGVDPGWRIVIGTSPLRGQAVPAYRALRFYFENPHLRSELGQGDPQAVTSVRVSDRGCGAPAE